MLERIAKSHQSKISNKHGNPIVAHLSTQGAYEPLCQAMKPKTAVWLRETDEGYNAVRDCNNCLQLAKRSGVRENDRAEVEVAVRVRTRIAQLTDELDRCYAKLEELGEEP